MDTAHGFTVRLQDLLRRERVALADFLVALAEFDERRLWVELGHSSLFYFLHRDLGLSKGAAFYRKTAAELIQRCPEIVEPLRDGRLCLTSVVELAKVVTPENREEVLPRFFQLSKREAKEVSAAIRPDVAPPHRDVVTAVRASGTAPVLGVADARQRDLGQLAAHPANQADLAQSSVHPANQDDAAQSAAHPANQADPAQPSVHPANQNDGAQSSVHPANQPDPAGPSARPANQPARPPARLSADARPDLAAAPSPRTRPDTMEPLHAQASRLHVTVSRRFLSKLEAARAALSHSHPGAGAEEILEAGLDLLLERHAKRKGLVARPRREPPPSKPDHVPAHVKRAVWERDGGRCQYPLASGGICGSTVRPQLDHVSPKARGGPPTVENLRICCAFHNDLAARQVFGEAWMDRYTRGPRACTPAEPPRPSS